MLRLVGSGYTVEGQKTGKEKHGGLQLEIIASYKVGLAKWLVEERDEALWDLDYFLDELKTPAELGLQAGDTIRSYPPDPTLLRDAIVDDLAEKHLTGSERGQISVNVGFH